MLDLMKTTIITILISLLGASAALATGDSDSEQSESEPKLVVQYKGSFEALDDTLPLTLSASEPQKSQLDPEVVKITEKLIKARLQGKESEQGQGKERKKRSAIDIQTDLFSPLGPKKINSNNNNEP
ncbi:MAG: hypothetical protein KA112_01075 [Alphaproteobacteria bacterium]|nr:hypothetical protein [Alphaproteobacteria bacterium]MBP7729193.1 hypothetical protein [Alphaproteobacteria bacterium]